MPTQLVVNVDEKAVLEVLRTRNIHTYFQPVVSLSSKAIIGFEAFSRGTREGREEVDPAQLFHNDLSPDSKIGVDRLCREKALEHFKPIAEKHQHMLLFLNVNSEILPHVELKSQVLRKQVADLGINPGQVVIECALNKATTDEAVAFSRMYRELGFRLSLDNCGIEDAFNYVLPLIKPAFVKVTSGFFAGEGEDGHSLRELRNLVSLADRVGAMVIGQGVESEENSIRLLSAGVHLQQGYYYTKDDGGGDSDPARLLLEKIVATHEKYKTTSRELVRRKKERFENLFRAVASVAAKLSNMGAAQFEEACKNLVRNVDTVISVFVLNDQGIQTTTRPHVKGEGDGLSTSVLGSAKGADHSVHDYFMYLDMGYEKFVTQPYVSLFTGEIACIVSRAIYNAEGIRHVVCVEVPHPG